DDRPHPQGHQPDGAEHPLELVLARRLGHQHLERFLRQKLVPGHTRFPEKSPLYLPHTPAPYRLSRINVTGPSLTNSTCIMAPNRPVAVGTPWARTASTNASYSGTAISGGAAPMKLGRRPFWASP